MRFWILRLPINRLLWCVQQQLHKRKIEPAAKLKANLFKRSCFGKTITTVQVNAYFVGSIYTGNNSMQV